MRYSMNLDLVWVVRSEGSLEITLVHPEKKAEFLDAKGNWSKIITASIESWVASDKSTICKFC